jgi:hypothetical protein
MQAQQIALDGHAIQDRWPTHGNLHQLTYILLTVMPFLNIDCFIDII